MPPVPRPVSASLSVLVASATATGLVAATGLAPSASAEPCTAPEANVAPPASEPVVPPGVTTPSPSGELPIGRKPDGANEQAPLPQLGPLISALFNPTGQSAAPMEQQAGVVPPAPNPPETAVDPGAPADPNAAAPSPDADSATDPAAAPAAPDAGAAVAGSQTSLVEWVSGPNSPNDTLQRFGISGTDLGIMWDNGDPANRQVLMAFGDTFGYCSLPRRQWRYNTLMRSQDRDLSRGISVPSGVASDRYSGSPVWQPGLSKQIVNSIKRADTEASVIPTAGTSVGNTQYLNFMSVKKWGGHGQWSTNYSALAASQDNGQSWVIFPGTVRTPHPDSVAGARHTPGNEHFQQGAFLQPDDGYLYSYGTPPGRGGPAYLARVPHGAVPDVTKYEYFNADGAGWVPGNPAAATPVIPGPVGELSVQYNSYLHQYLALYSNGAHNIVARTAPAPQGPWGPEQTLVSSTQLPGGVYAPYMHPWTNGKDVYFNLSLWSAYNVMLMRTELA